MSSSSCIGGIEDLCLGNYDMYADGSVNYMGVLLEVIIFIYCFAGLAIVCDDHLVMALETACHRMNMPNHVAGASFMAFGSAAPEIVFNSITTLRGQGDTELGVSTILGSGYIAFLLIPAVCALAASKRLVVKKSVTIRDSVGYMVSLLCLCWFVSDGVVDLHESLALCGIFVLYMLAVFYPMYRPVFDTCLGVADLSEYQDIPDGGGDEAEPTETTSLLSNNNRDKNIDIEDVDSNGQELVVTTTKRASLSDPHAVLKRTLTRPEIYHYPHEVQDILIHDKQEHHQHQHPTVSDSDSDDDAEEDNEPAIVTTLLAPLRWIFALTCHECDVGTPEEGYWPLTFFVSFLWIAFFSIVVAACIDRWVALSGVSMNLFGLCVVALSAEIPDTIQSVAVARRGHGSMAVSNCLGTQIINISFGLGIPWLLANLFLGRDTPGIPEVYFPDPLTLELTASVQVLNVCLYTFLVLGLAWVYNTQYAYMTKTKAKILVSMYIFAIVGNYFLVDYVADWFNQQGWMWQHVDAQGHLH